MNRGGNTSGEVFPRATRDDPRAQRADDPCVRRDSVSAARSENSRPPDVDVLVVDDDAAFRASTGEVIASCGYSVMRASDGLEALELLSKLVVGVLVLDIQMPRLGGLELLDRLEQPPPTVLLSAFETIESDHPDDAKVVRLHKPATPNDLLFTIAGAIGPPRQASSM